MSPKKIRPTFATALMLATLTASVAASAAAAANGKQRPVSNARQRSLYGWTQSSATDRCAWPYRNQFPPCMSTWPEGDPNYHGWRR
jgi:hypothetical protein